MKNNKDDLTEKALELVTSVHSIVSIDSSVQAQRELQLVAAQSD